MIEPIFKSIFAETWDHLLPVMHKHYANRPFSHDVTVVEGVLDVWCAWPMKLLAPLMKLMGQIPVRSEKNVAVSVHFKSEPNSKVFHLKRTFYFKNSKPYVFHSRMVQIKDDEVVEMMKFGIGWKMRCFWDGEKVVLQHCGYTLNLFGKFIPLPLTFLLGKAYAEETAIDDNTFDMLTHITHPWWGKIYEYKGRFTVQNANPIGVAND